jgi:P27 family predicted phage terminase small subunit
VVIDALRQRKPPFSPDAVADSATRMVHPSRHQDIGSPGWGGGLKNLKGPKPRRAPQSRVNANRPRSNLVMVGNSHMLSAMNSQPPPAHLSPSAQDWWRSCVDRYVLEEHHLRLLRLCCEAWDRAQEAREQLRREGLTVPTRDGGLRSHPCVAIERDARLAVARLVRELDLDVEPPASDRIGPPPIFSNRGRHARKAQSS